MTPSSRINASIDLLSEILSLWQGEKRIPADKIIDRYFKNRRFIGSKDRAYVGELVYWCLRNLAVVEWYAERQDARLLVFISLLLRKEHTIAELHNLCDGDKYSPHTITPNERAVLVAAEKKQASGMPTHVRLNYPEWMDALLRDTLGLEFEAAMQAMAEQAHTDLRVNTLKTTREALLATLTSEGFECAPTPRSPVGIRLHKRGPVFTSSTFKQGHFEMQDEGSQLVAALVDAEPGMKVIDFCAGAGGKTLAIAAQMQNKGRIMAWDTSAKRLLQIKERLKRAGVDNVQTYALESENDAFIKRHKQTADRVLVDAPCSGTGTWRRNPDLKWRFSRKDLDEVIAVQESILQSASRLVKTGGRLVYATCSILADENDRQIEKFLKHNPNFRVASTQKIWNKIPSTTVPLEDRDDNKMSFLWVTPHQDGVDGFFAAVLERM